MHFEMDLRSKVNSLISIGSLESAAPLAQYYYSLNDDDPMSCLPLLTVYNQLGQHTRIVEFMKSNNYHTVPELLIYYISALFKLSKYKDVIATITSLCPEVYESSSSLLLFLAKSYLLSDSPEQASPVFCKCIASDPLCLEAIDLLVHSRLLSPTQLSKVLSQHSDAVQSFLPFSALSSLRKPLTFGQISHNIDTMLSSNPELATNVSIVSSLVNGHLSNGYPIAGIRCVRNAFTKLPLDLDLFVPLIICSFLAGDASTLLEIQSTVSREKKFKEVCDLIDVLLVFFNSKINTDDDYVSTIQSIINQSTSINFQYMCDLLLGHLLLFNQQTDSAILQYRLCATKYIGCIVPFLSLSSIYLRNSSLSLARRFISLCNAINSNDPRVLHEEGVLMVGEGRVEEAKEVFIRVLKMLPSDLFLLSFANGKNCLLNSFFGSGNLVFDLKCSTLSNLALVCLRLSDYSNAKFYAQQCLELFSMDESALLVLAVSLHHEGSLSDAIVKYQKYLTLVPKSFLAVQMLNLALEEVEFSI
ncbi:hypothetical protein P9112_009039 [Eukaryota sp. TZLM1-RC]